MKKEFKIGAAETVLDELVEEIGRGMYLIGVTDDVAYRRIANGTGSVGAQFRHNLDFVVCLLKAVQTGQIDYNARERDVRVETDRLYAGDRFAAVIDRLCDLDPRIIGHSVLIRSEIEKNLWLPSSIAREVEFVHSHTVHHHALIAEKLAGFGVTVGENFGVAPSTLEHWKKQAA